MSSGMEIFSGGKEEADISRVSSNGLRWGYCSLAFSGAQNSFLT